MLKFIGGAVVVWWIGGILGVAIGGGIVYWLVRRFAGTRDVAG